MNKAPDHSERSHSIMGTSRAPIYMGGCTGYFSAIKDLPPEEESDAQDAGNKFHETMEIVMGDFLEHKLSGTDAEISYEHLRADPEIDSEMWGHIEEAKKQVWEKGFEKSLTGKSYGLEEPFYLGEVEVGKEKIKIGGAVDVWCAYKDKKGLRYALDLDYKYGYTPVGAKSKQLLCSAIAIYYEFKKMGVHLDYVRAVVYQPRLPGEAWKETKYSAQALEYQRNKFLQVADDVFIKGKVKFKAGEHCHWCPARGHCSVRTKYLQEQSGLSVIRESPTLPKPEMLSVEQTEKILTYKKQIENFLTAVYSLSLRKQLKKPFLKNFKLVEGISKRKFKKEISVVAKALKEHGVKKPFRPPVDELITIGEAEKELKKVGKNKEEVFNILSHLTEKGQAAKILVPLEDERPALPSYKDLLTHKED